MSYDGKIAELYRVLFVAWSMWAYYNNIILIYNITGSIYANIIYIS